MSPTQAITKRPAGRFAFHGRWRRAVRSRGERAQRTRRRRNVVGMELPETMQPSSDERIAGWIGVMMALGAGALWISRHRRAAAGSPDRG